MSANTIEMNINDIEEAAIIAGSLEEDDLMVVIHDDKGHTAYVPAVAPKPINVPQRPIKLPESYKDQCRVFRQYLMAYKADQGITKQLDQVTILELFEKFWSACGGRAFTSRKDLFLVAMGMHRYWGTSKVLLIKQDGKLWGFTKSGVKWIEREVIAIEPEVLDWLNAE